MTSPDQEREPVPTIRDGASFVRMRRKGLALMTREETRGDAITGLKNFKNQNSWAGTHAGRIETVRKRCLPLHALRSG
ncbi:MAG: hypothetical protein PHF57_08005 [Methanoregula sp.]|nr:hypothetical protein [Methanoregula sp.]